MPLVQTVHIHVLIPLNKKGFDPDNVQNVNKRTTEGEGQGLEHCVGLMELDVRVSEAAALLVSERCPLHLLC